MLLPQINCCLQVINRVKGFSFSSRQCWPAVQGERKTLEAEKCPRTSYAKHWCKWVARRRSAGLVVVTGKQGKLWGLLGLGPSNAKATCGGPNQAGVWSNHVGREDTA